MHCCFLAVLGSPPQVRGKRIFEFGLGANIGITPAGAGKTMCVTTRTKTLQDHPRRCGENNDTVQFQIKEKGSPPQVRGKPRAKFLRAKTYRITPAGAGKTLKRSFRNQPFCSGAVQISFNFSNSLNVSSQSGSAR